MREDYERTKRMALRYATRKQRLHIEETRYDTCDWNPTVPPLIAYLPDTHPEFIAFSTIAEEYGQTHQNIYTEFHDVMDANPVWYGSVPRVFWDAVKAKREADKCLHENRRKLTRLSRTSLHQKPSPSRLKLPSS